MLVRHGLETGDFLFLGDDFLRCGVEGGFYFLVCLARYKRGKGRPGEHTLISWGGMGS